MGRLPAIFSHHPHLLCFVLDRGVVKAGIKDRYLILAQVGAKCRWDNENIATSNTVIHT